MQIVQRSDGRNPMRSRLQTAMRGDKGEWLDTAPQLAGGVGQIHADFPNQQSTASAALALVVHRRAHECAKF